MSATMTLLPAHRRQQILRAGRGGSGHVSDRAALPEELLPDADITIA
jgi:hypothetical protein